MHPAFRPELTRSALARYLMTLASLVFVAMCLPARANAPAPDTATREYEIRFMEDMIAHHMMAVEMGEICVQKAVHLELQVLCQNIITTQEQEIALMQQWLATWYGITGYQPEMTPGQMAQMQRLAALSGAEFEIEFMRTMIRHHKTAVVKGSQCMQRAYHQELQDMCAAIVSTQTGEIQQMEDWLCVWYGICRPRHQR